ncbi:MAG: haloacid dehalogenase type II [Azospirillaceae bacterium]|nr:haloacid dehalogenase type II [Azospirillaceae bacterium]
MSTPSHSRRSLLKSIAGSALLAALPKVSAAATAAFDARAIKVLAFDFQGSCVDYTSPLMAMGAQINKDKKLDIDWSVMSSDWRDAYHEIMVPVLAHRQPYIPTEKVYRQALDIILDRHHLSDRFSVAERDEMSGVWGRMVPWPDTREGLSRLKTRFTLVTLSNSGMATVMKMVKANALPFDEVLTGELAQNYKPAPEVYGLVPQMTGVRRDEVLFCATHFYDLKDAKAFGFSTAWWPRPLELGPGHKIDTDPKPFVDVYAADLIDLAVKLGA